MADPGGEATAPPQASVESAAPAETGTSTGGSPESSTNGVLASALESGLNTGKAPETFQALGAQDKGEPGGSLDEELKTLTAEDAAVRSFGEELNSTDNIAGKAIDEPKPGEISPPSQDSPATVDTQADYQSEHDAIFNNPDLSTEGKVEAVEKLNAKYNTETPTAQSTDNPAQTESTGQEPYDASLAATKERQDKMRQKSPEELQKLASEGNEAAKRALTYQEKQVSEGAEAYNKQQAEAQQTESTQTESDTATDTKTEEDRTPEQISAEQRVRRDETVAELKAKNPDLDLRDPDLQKALAEAEADPTGAKFEELKNASETVSDATKKAEERADEIGGLSAEDIKKLASSDVQTLASTLREIAAKLEKSGNPAEQKKAEKMNSKLKILLIILAAILVAPVVGTAAAVGAGGKALQKN